MKIEVTFLRRVPFIEMHRVDPAIEMLGFQSFTMRQKIDDARSAGRYRMALEAIRAANPDRERRDEIIGVALQEPALWRAGRSL